MILLVSDDEALTYLIERYGQKSGFEVRVERTLPTTSEGHRLEPAVVWIASIDALATVRPRETGVISDDAPVVVCSSVADERRARELGADYSVLHPLTYPDFLAALSAVGLPARDGTRP